MTFKPRLLALVAGMALAIAGSGAIAQIINSAPQPGAPAFGSQSDQVRLYHRNQVIVKFADGADPEAVLEAAMAGDRESYRAGAAFDLVPQGTGATLVDLSAAAVQIESTQSRYGIERPGGTESTGTVPLDQLIDRLNADPRVEYAQKNYLLHAFQADLINDILGGRKAPNDPYYEFQWHLKKHGTALSAEAAPGAVNFPAAWDKFTPQRNVVVAVVDTGQVFAHDDVAGANLLPGYDFVSDPFSSNDGDGRDADPTDAGDGTAADECFPGSTALDSTWHGSHVSGIAGLAATNNDLGIAGPLPSGVSFVPVRVLGKCGGSFNDIVDGMLWAAGIDVPGVPANPNPALVINMSLGGYTEGCLPAIADAIAQVRAKGAVVVVAAGNEADDSQFYSPAGCSEAFTVAASDIMGALSPYSNYGPKVDILSPGGDTSVDLNGDSYADGILSIVDGGYSFYQGTSMASPLVAAALALALANNPGWTVDDATSRMTAAAMPRSAAECGQACGAGLMDVAGLLSY